MLIFNILIKVMPMKIF